MGLSAQSILLCRRFQPGEDPSRALLLDCENRWIVCSSIISCTSLFVTNTWKTCILYSQHIYLVVNFLLNFVLNLDDKRGLGPSNSCSRNITNKSSINIFQLNIHWPTEFEILSFSMPICHSIYFIVYLILRILRTFQFETVDTFSIYSISLLTKPRIFLGNISEEYLLTTWMN